MLLPVYHSTSFSTQKARSLNRPSEMKYHRVGNLANGRWTLLSLCLAQIFVVESQSRLAITMVHLTSTLRPTTTTANHNNMGFQGADIIYRCHSITVRDAWKHALAPRSTQRYRALAFDTLLALTSTPL
ncbi:hypothetical protein L208DRAFT_535333 [Tricholoma matsutake]|nr:hypothetical protein L208DRAFT_535333 [Tricholoma matsutake 945]